MDTADPPPSAFDALLDLRFRGERIDPDAFLSAHPELTESERDQIRRFCRGRKADEPSTPTQPAESPNADRTDPPIPRLGGYRLGRRLGAGGMGAVFLAQDESLGRPVAVKILGPDLLGTGERSERFLREARAVARLRHPNIVDVYSAGEQDGFRYMAMEFVPGANLHDLIAEATDRGARLAVTEVIRWGIEIARALEAAHRANIVHRDVKPSNIRVTESGRAVLLDFGLVLEKGAATLTLSGGFRGSPQYASPEQVGVAGVPIDARTDVYSLGATLYEALTGVAPFRGETRDQLFNHILNRDPIALRRLDPSIPRDLETVVLAALEKEPKRRYASAAALAADLEALRDGRPISVRPVSVPGRLVRWARRQPVKAGLAVTAVAGVLAAAALGGFVLSNLDRLERATATERASRLASLLEEGFLTYSEGGDPSQAIPVFEEALRVDGNSREAHSGLALARASNGDLAGALAGLEACQDAATGSWNALLRADVLEQLGRRAEADAILRALQPASTPVDHFVLGALQLKKVHRGLVESAAHSFDHLRLAVMGSHSPNALYYHELGHTAWHAGLHKEAREVASMIERLFPESPKKWFAIARTLQDADPDGLVRALEKAARPPPQSFGLRSWISNRLMRFGRAELVDLGLSLAVEMVAQRPNDATAHLTLGAARFAQHDFERAVEEFREAVRLKPSVPGAHRMLAECLASQRDYAGAAVPAREAARLEPFDPKVWNILGTALVEPKDLDEAIACFEKALGLAPDSPEMLCNLGRSLARRGEFARALELVRRGHEKGSKDPAWKYPSKAWLASGQRWAALEKRFEAFSRGEGELPAINERIAFAHEICRAKKRYAEAVRLYEESFRIDPDLAVPAGLRPGSHLLVQAAACALSAGLGAGVDAPADSAERARLRERARSWFEQDVAACEDALRVTPHKSDDLAKLIPEWRKEPSVAGTRPPAIPEGLPAEEVAAWSRVWARHDALQSRTTSRVSR